MCFEKKGNAYYYFCQKQASLCQNNIDARSSYTVTATQAGATVPVSATLTGGMVYSVFAVGLLKGTPALAFKLGAVAGVPGMPGTGSDPRPVAHVASNNPMMPWFFGVLALFLLGTSMVARRFALARQK